MVPVRNNQNWIPEIFNDFFENEWMPRNNNSTSPAINVLENTKCYNIEVAAPGMTKEDFNVHLDEEGNLVIEMEKKKNAKEEDKESHYIRREFAYGKFHQTMILPDDVRREDISGKVENGVLYVNIPKIEKVDGKDIKRSIAID